MTITEALQEIKTLKKRIEKKKEFILQYLWRQNHMRDPHEASGGSQALVRQETQAINDLENNIVNLRKKIAEVNMNNVITISGETKSIADWIIWRREIAEQKKSFLNDILRRIDRTRSDARSKGIDLTDTTQGPEKFDVIININESELLKEIEKIECIISTLDGQLSLKNATVQI